MSSLAKALSMSTNMLDQLQCYLQHTIELMLQTFELPAQHPRRQLWDFKCDCSRDLLHKSATRHHAVSTTAMFHVTNPINRRGQHDLTTAYVRLYICNDNPQPHMQINAGKCIPPLHMDAPPSQTTRLLKRS